jgi:uncharacterized BrkB/YihY/UPF0761 family membrane protein
VRQKYDQTKQYIFFALVLFLFSSPCSFFFLDWCKTSSRNQCWPRHLLVVLVVLVLFPFLIILLSLSFWGYILSSSMDAEERWNK